MELQIRGAILRSGGAFGADSAFEKGAGAAKEIFRGQDATKAAIELAGQYHPAWPACSSWARRLHGRNSMILLGQDLNDPVDFVVCWTPGGLVTGGTGQAIRVARAYNIPVLNLFEVTPEEVLEYEY